MKALALVFETAKRSRCMFYGFKRAFSYIPGTFAFRYAFPVRIFYRRKLYMQIYAVKQRPRKPWRGICAPVKGCRRTLWWDGQGNRTDTDSCATSKSGRIGLPFLKRGTPTFQAFKRLRAATLMAALEISVNGHPKQHPVVPRATLRPAGDLSRLYSARPRWYGAAP